MLGKNLISASGRSPVTVVASTSLTNQTSDASRTLTLSSGFQVGDTLVAMTANRSTTVTAPTLLSGYTNIIAVGSSGTNRNLRVQYKTATSTSETITWTGAYGWLIAIRNFQSIGQTNSTSSTTSSTTMTLPNLSGLQTDGKSLIIAGAYFSSGYTSTTTPYTLLGDFAANVTKNTDSALTGETITAAAAGVQVLYAIEFT